MMPRVARRISLVSLNFAFILVLLFPCFSQAQTQGQQAQPYFASFKSDEVNLRVGPSKDHPIIWVYHRKGLPVQVIDAHNEWRQIVDPFNDKGWVQKSLLSSRRSVLTHTKTVALRSHPSISSASIAEVEPGVVCVLQSCNQHWCKVEAGNYRGWLEKTTLWGVRPDEIIE